MAKSAVQRKPICPQCGRAESVVCIAYRFPTDSARRLSEEGALLLGGCVVEYHSPAWFCRSCEVRFGELGSAA